MHGCSDLSDRVVRLERHNRYLASALGICMTLLLAATRQDPLSDLVRAKRFESVGEQGEAHAELGFAAGEVLARVPERKWSELR